MARVMPLRIGGLKRLQARLGLLRKEEGGAQIVEFAISLPLLVVLAVGIFDFGSAFNVKQRLSYMAQEAARVGANQPRNDLTATGDCTQLTSVCAVRDAVEHSLVSNKMKDCGLATAAPVGPVGANYQWTFTANTGCPGNLVLTIERSHTYTVTLDDPFPNAQFTIESTTVSLQYPYQWEFNKVITLLVPSANYGGPISSTALMQNLN